MKKYIIILASVFAVAIMGVAGVATASSSASQEYFATSGYVIDAETSEKIAFTEQTAFSASSMGSVQFQTAEGTSATLSDDSFVHLDDGSVMALSDGVLLDFADLSSNFINNYYTTRTLSITESGTSFVAETESGTITFGEHLWKLSDDKYIIRSSSISVYFSDTDMRDAGNYVEVHITSDGIVQMLTENDTWMTISESCYIETAGGVTVNPITKVIDNGDYQITINNLVISADDSIVLTEDETRRQIVPEINIDTIDGVDGVDGTSGTDGTGGTEGESGDAGNDGIVGGAGDTGGTGSSGSNGAKGVDAVTDSSTNTSLPTMSITDWNVTTTSLQATIAVGGNYDALNITSSAKEYYSAITITNVETGEVLYGYQVDEGYRTDPVDEGWQITNFENGVDVYFTTWDSDDNSIAALSPDTAYVLSISAYYEINGAIYYREFISRTFYTDSSGVQFQYADATTDSITVSYSQTGTGTTTLYLLTVAQNESFSLASKDDTTSYTDSFECNSSTEEAVFDGMWGEGLSSDTNYIVRAYIVVSEEEKTLSNQALSVYTLKETPTWSTSESPTADYNRVNGAYEVSRPTVSDSDGGVEYYVYTVYNDDDNDAVVATKTVYPGDAEPITFFLTAGVNYTFGVEMYFNDNEKVIVYDLGVSAPVKTEGSSLPSITWSATNINYDGIEGIITITLDGESKIDTSQSIYLQVYADQVLDNTYTMTTESVDAADDDYDDVYYTNTNTNYIQIYVKLGNLYNNTTYTFTIMGAIDLENTDTSSASMYTLGFVSAGTYATSTLSVSDPSNTSIADSTSASSATTTDSLAITSLSSASSASASTAAITSLSFVSEDPAVITSLESAASTTATMTALSTTSSTAISEMVKITVVEGTAGLEEVTHTKEQLQNGKVVVYLYKGTGSTRVLLGTTEYTTASTADGEYTVADFYENGILITESSFGLSNITAGQTYSIVIDTVYDDTYDMNLNYINEFTNISGQTIIVTSAETPPDLSTTPNSEVKVTEIYNSDATDYLAKYDDSMPDDTVIGYVVQSNYDNSQRLAKTVTYYLYEYSEFYNAAVNTGNEPSALKTVTLDTPNTSDTVPAIAVFFDDVEFASTVTLDGNTTINGCTIYQGADSSKNDITRGYYYLFAYTVEYSTSDAGSTSTYPDDHDDYSSYASLYGCGTEVYKKLVNVTSANSVYVLNSGLIEAPKAEPEFYAYVYEVTGNTATVHYTFTDSDDAVVTEDGEGDITQIQYTNEYGTSSFVDVNASTLSSAANDELQWYKLVMNYDIDQTGDLLQPQVLINDYITDYSTILNDLWNGEYVAEPFYLVQIPVEDIEAYSKTTATAGQVLIKMDTTNMKNNYITFTLSNMSTAATGGVLTTLQERAYALKLVFSDASGSDDVIADQTFYMPITTVGTTSSVVFSTSQISDFLDKKFTVQAWVLYDDGTQGWALLDGDDTNTSYEEYFALQGINTVTNGEVDEFELTTYITYGGTSYTPNGGLLTSTRDSDFLSSLQGTVQEDSEDNTTFSKTFSYMSSTTSFTRRLSVQRYGVSNSTSSNYEDFAGYYMVPKGVATYQVLFSGSVDTSEATELTTITPTVGGLSTSVSVDRIQFNDFTINGSTQIDSDTDGSYDVTMKIYTSYDDAIANATTNIASKTVTLQAAENGGYYQSASYWSSYNDTSDGNGTGGFVIDELSANTTYYYVFTASIENTETLLLDVDSPTQVAVFSFETTDGIKITPSADGLVYYNFSYQTKQLYLTYTLNEILGVSVEYDIYSSEDVELSSGEYVFDKENEDDADPTPLLSYETMTQSGILTESSVTWNSSVKVDLTPSVNRADLVPGGTYYLRIKAYTDSGVASEILMPFTITSVGNISALIFVDDKSSTSITYKITITDAQYSLMNIDNADHDGPYVVRFTDASGNRVYTTYDDVIFYSEEYQQEIVLDDSTLDGDKNGDGYKAMTANTTYVLTVYSLADLEHDGYSYPIATTAGTTTLDSDTKKDVNYFYDSADGEWKNFIALVDSFWVTDGTYNRANIADMDGVEDNFSIANNTQTTTDITNLYLSDAYTTKLDSSNNITFALTGSYGIVTTDDTTGVQTQAFEKIEYTIQELTTSGGDIFTGESTGDLFVKGENLVGLTTYTYTIPQVVSSTGYYLVTIKLYTSASSTEAYKTYSFTYGG